MSSPPLVRSLLPLLLLLLPASLREYLQPKDAGEIHPVVLVPGMCCSDLEVRLTEAYQPPPSAPRRCGAMKGRGWFELWKNVSDLAAHEYTDCFMEQMRLLYDPAADDYRNLPGIETRVPNFGSPRGFRCKDPLKPKQCFDYVREGLERFGYRDGDTLFGAPYDWRHAPTLPGQHSEVFARYFDELKALVEAAASTNKKKKKKVIVVGHSFGGMVALEFVRNTTLAWRDRHIKHLVLLAPTPSGGFLHQLRRITTGPWDFTFVGAGALALRPMWRSFESSIVDLPSPQVFGHTPLVITRQRNYSAHDMEDLLADIGFARAVEPFRRRMVPRMSYFQAPMVPTTCVNGVGVRTAEQLVFWEGDFDADPGIVYGDGDGSVNLASMLAFDREMSRHPGQKKQFQSVWIPGVQHAALLTEERAVARVVREILKANRI